MERPLQPAGLIVWRCISVLVALTALGSAHAAPVAQWSYAAAADFTAATFTDGGGVTYRAADELSWGTAEADFAARSDDPEQNRNALTIGSALAGSATGGGVVSGELGTSPGRTPDFGRIALGSSLTYWNNLMAPGSATLQSGQLLDRLVLTPLLPDQHVEPVPVEVPSVAVNFEFRQTLAEGDAAGLCADGRSHIEYHQGCPDLFGFQFPTLNNGFRYYDAEDGLWRDYFVHLFVFDSSNGALLVAPLSMMECRALNLEAGCFGFRSGKNQVTTASFAFAITTEAWLPSSPVSEPGIPALLGLALCALGCSRCFGRQDRGRSEKPVC